MAKVNWTITPLYHTTEIPQNHNTVTLKYSLPQPGIQRADFRAGTAIPQHRNTKTPLHHTPMNDTATTWIQIAQQVAANPFVKIPCPECGESYLQILIAPWQNEEPKVDVHLICENCDARNTITKNAEVTEKITAPH